MFDEDGDGGGEQNYMDDGHVLEREPPAADRTLGQLSQLSLSAIESREVEREWGPPPPGPARSSSTPRWADAGGSFYGGTRMIALKDDPVWSAISRFGRPWPPYDYNSGMGIEDISREEAEQLGVIAPGAKVSPPQKQFTSDLAASVKNLSPEVQRALAGVLGDSAELRADGTLAYKAKEGA